MADVVLHSKLREIGDEIKVEREVRFRQGKELQNLRIDIDDLDIQLEEALEAKEREVELNRRLKQEYADLKQKYDNLNNQNEEFNFSFKRRSEQQIAELSAHVEALSKSKSKYEKDNKQFLLEIEDLRSEVDSLSRSKSHAVSLCKELEMKEAEYLLRIDEILKQLTEAFEQKNKTLKENAEIFIKIERYEFEIQQLNISIKRITVELDDSRLHLENEIMFRSNIEIKLRNVQLDLDSANARLEDAQFENDELHKQILKIQDEARSNRDKIDKELESKNEEIEDVKRRLNSKYTEVTESLTETISKLSITEKNKSKLQVQVESLIADLDSTRRRADEASRREKQLEKEVEELKNKLSASNAELDAALQANRNYSSELSKSKYHSEQLSEQLEIISKEKRRIIEELESSNTSLSEYQLKYSDLDRRLRAVDGDRLAILSQLDDLRDALQVESVKYQNLLSQHDKYKIDIEKRLLDKDDELDAQRQAHRRQIEQLQETIQEYEAKYKIEISSIRKKYSIEIEELRSNYEHSKKLRIDLENNIKKIQQINKELSDKLLEEQHAHDATREQLNGAEKRASSIRGELEELRTLYDRLEKTKKIIEIEFSDIESKYSESQSYLNRALAERKKYESDYAELYESIHDLKIELKNAEERARNATAAVVKKDEELRHEREVTLEIDASRKALEQQLREYQLRVEESDEYSRKEVKRVSIKFEARIVHIESELDLERGRTQDLIKEIRRLEKRVKDLTEQLSEEQTRVLSLTDSHDKLQEKMRKYRGQIEGAEGQVAVNISKCRRLQRELEDAEERAETMTRTFLRSNSTTRNADNYEGDNYVVSSAIEEYSNAVAPANNTPSYLRSTYLYSKPSNIDDYSISVSKSTSGSWRPRYRTVDLNEEDTIITSSRNNKYSNNYSSSSGYHRQNYQSEYLRGRPAATATTSSSSISRVSKRLKRAMRGLSV